MNNFSKRLRTYLHRHSSVVLNSDVDFSERYLTYWELEQFLLVNEEKSAIENLHEIRLICEDEMKHMGSAVISDIALDLILKFFNETTLLKKHHSELREKFGNIKFAITQQLFSLVQTFKDTISSQCFEFIYSNTQIIKDINDETYFRMPCNCLPNNFVKRSLIAQRAQKLESMKAVENFSMLYNASAPSTSYASKLMTGDPKQTWFTAFLKEYNASQYSDEEFTRHVTDMVTSKMDLRTELNNYFGFENHDFYLYLQKNKMKIEQHLNKDVNIPGNSQIPKPPYAVQVTVNSQKEKDLSKKIKKIENKKSQPELSWMEPLYHAYKEELFLQQHTSLLKRKQAVEVKYPNVYDSRKNIGPTKCNVKIANERLALTKSFHNIMPAESNHIDRLLYEEFTVPADDKKSMPKITKLVPISELDQIGQVIFRGINHLNMIQSIVFPVAYATNENMLICAPTGAGKTNIALLAITHQLRQYSDKGKIDTNQFKIVYVVPMKALANEVTATFSSKLSPVGIKVRELTGDMQLTKKEIRETQIIVTTPEKWDVITRKGSGDNGITEFLKLLIIDEVHLLHGCRGPVIEALVARTLRQVETSQSMIRIVGLSATLPNYIDVAKFLNVNPNIGLFFFDGRFRPVPLTQVFVGIKAMQQLQIMSEMNNVTYTKVSEFVRQGHQAMVFVHARNQTVHTAMVLKEKVTTHGHELFFQPTKGIETTNAKRAFAKSPNKALPELLEYGFGIHHAGLLRSDRNMVEKYFREGVIRVLICTATLAWGVNLPAHGVIIKGTELYDSNRGTFVNLDILDVLQIFGRAGRPQYDTSGTGVIITTQSLLRHYMMHLTHQIPIESSFLERLPDHLNAEIVLGTVSNVNEAVNWLSYTYLHHRLVMNPQNYGIPYSDVMKDPSLFDSRIKFINEAAKLLDKAHMIRYNANNGDFMSTDLGRTASHYYINYDTVQLFNNCIEPFMTEKEVLIMISQSEEFNQLKVRNEEIEELDRLTHEYCELAIPEGSTSVPGKVNILMQTYLSRGKINNFSLVSDMNYIIQNVVRITRALFDIALHQNNPMLAGRCLMLSQMFELQLWDFQNPLRQFTILNYEIIDKLERSTHTIESLREDDIKSLTSKFRNQRYAALIKKCATEFPMIEVESLVQPITRSVLRIKMKVYPNFVWNDKVHGKTSESFWLWIEDPENNSIYYSEHFVLSKSVVINAQPVELTFTVPLVEPPPSQYLARLTSERWLGSSLIHSLSFRELVLPESHPPHTDLLELQPLPVTVLKNKKFEKLFKFSHFNPIQTQIFHCLYHTDNNTLVGAPTGSGKTIMAELAVLRMFNKYPDKKIVYIAPLKALVRERVIDWKERFSKIGKRVTELTGDVNPNINEINKAKIIITTPEKWDGLSRSWQSRHYVKEVGLMIIDEIHLLGEDRGPVLEVIVSRTNYIAANTNKKLRIVGLSTAMANAKDLGNWLDIKEMGLYNFRPSVRPVPLEVHISGYPGKHYCPRMISMNKPTYQAIRLHSPDSPSLVFVSSRRQTRLTALDLIAYLATDSNPKQWLNIDEEEMMQIVSTVKDHNLKLSLTFGIGLHHAGLEDHDRKVTEELFVNQKIQVLIATATLAWGVNFPAHLVVVKGTEYFDGKTGRYVDMPITDVLQMMGRAGRPQYDNTGVAVVLVHDIKKNFYKKFLYEPFPVESNLLQVLPDHINAEIVAGTVSTKKDVLEYLTWTYFFRRLIQNPTYYNLPNLEPETINTYLTELTEATLDKLIRSKCIEYDDEELSCFRATSLGHVASYFYLSNETMLFLSQTMSGHLDIEQLLVILSGVHEYAEFPVRHNEDLINSEFSINCRYKADDFISPHTKVFLLLQAHYSRLTLPISDYYTDTKSALEQTIRILQAMIDVAATKKWLAVTLHLQHLLQMTIQGCWIDDNPLLTLYDFTEKQLEKLRKDFKLKFSDYNQNVLAGIRAAYKSNRLIFMKMIQTVCDEAVAQSVIQILDGLPAIGYMLQFYDDSDNKIHLIKRDENDELHASIRANKSYSIEVLMKRQGKKSLQVAARHFPKYKDEMWFLALGIVRTDTLLALKRISIRGTCSNQISFNAPKRPGNYIMSLYSISDSYIGLDEQYDIQLEVSQ